MRKCVFLTAMMLFSGLCSFAQENMKHNILSLENRICELIHKKPELAQMNGLRLFHVFWVRIGDKGSLINNDCIDSTFFTKLSFANYKIRSHSLFRKDKRFLKTQTFITDSIGNLVAVADARYIWYKTTHFQDDIMLAKMFFNKKVDYAFYAEGQLGHYIGIKDNQLFAI